MNHTGAHRDYRRPSGRCTNAGGKFAYTSGVRSSVCNRAPSSAAKSRGSSVRTPPDGAGR
nr:hypothetical protein GCM10020063_041190 [Dactylosporangium thailandense]